MTLWTALCSFFDVLGGVKLADGQGVDLLGLDHVSVEQVCCIVAEGRSEEVLSLPRGLA